LLGTADTHKALPETAVGKAVGQHHSWMGDWLAQASAQGLVPIVTTRFLICVYPCKVKGVP